MPSRCGRRRHQRGYIEQLPVVVQVAAEDPLVVGTHRAVAFLQAEGLISMTRGRRAAVTDDVELRQAVG